MKKIIIFCVLLFSFGVANAQKRTISGTLYDKENGETMIGASVSIKELPGVGTACNVYGFYSLTAPEGQYTIEVSFIGYQKITKTVDLTSNQLMDFYLIPDAESVEEVVISAKKKNDNIRNDKIGAETIKIEEVENIPVLMGERDVVKILALTPGVKTTGEGTGGLFVRGGTSAQNLILLDEATVYNPNHLLGFFSTFNSDAIKDLTLYKGTAPAEYGGRVSSVMDIKMKEGNNQKFHFGGSVGLISAKLNVEGPLSKGKGSFFVSGRRTYADLFLKLSNNERLSTTQLYFYDINAKVNYKIDDKNRVFLSGYFGRDVLKLQDRIGLDWGNISGTFRLNHIWSSKLFSNTSIIYSDYDYKIDINGAGDSEGFSLKSVIKNWTFKQDFQYFLDEKNTLSFGAQSQYHTVIPGQLEVSDSSEIIPVKLEERYGLENAIFISDSWKPNKHWNINFGLRLSSFSMLSPGSFYSYDEEGQVSDTSSVSYVKFMKNYFHLEPRINVNYIINDASSIKASYTRNTQNLHLIQNATSSTPTDIWILSSNNIKPEISDQVSVGYFQNLFKDKLQLSGEVYYRWMQNQIDLKDGANIQSNQFLEGELLSGVGRSYGLELMAKKKYGKLTGWVAYTLSRTERKIEGINNGDWYAAKQDATHDFSIVGIYNFNKVWSVSATWVYTTGNAVTFPSGKYEVDGEVNFYYTERNESRMPDYHRLDLGVTIDFPSKKRWENSLNFSIYNAYAQKNAFSIDFEEDENDPTKTVAVKTYLFSILPSLSYNFKF